MSESLSHSDGMFFQKQSAFLTNCKSLATTGGEEGREETPAAWLSCKDAIEKPVLVHGVCVRPIYSFGFGGTRSYFC